MLNPSTTRRTAIGSKSETQAVTVNATNGLTVTEGGVDITGDSSVDGNLSVGGDIRTDIDGIDNGDGGDIETDGGDITVRGEGDNTAGVGDDANIVQTRDGGIFEEGRGDIIENAAGSIREGGSGDIFEDGGGNIIENSAGFIEARNFDQSDRTRLEDGVITNVLDEGELTESRTTISGGNATFGGTLTAEGTTTLNAMTVHTTPHHVR